MTHYEAFCRSGWRLPNARSQEGYTSVRRPAYHKTRQGGAACNLATLVTRMHDVNAMHGAQYFARQHRSNTIPSLSAGAFDDNTQSIPESAG